MRRTFSFSPSVTKTDFAFLWHAGKMNTGKKRFDLTLENAVAGTGRVPREGGAHLWRTTLLARSSELYLPAHGGRERWMRHLGIQLSRQPGRRIPRAATSGMLRPMKSGGWSDRSQIVPRTVRREVYKAPVPPQRPHRPGYRILFPVLVSKLPLADGSFPAVDTKIELVGYHAS